MSTATATDRPEDQRLSAGATLLYGFQHILTMYGGVITVPLIIGIAGGLSTAENAVLIAAALFVSGAATLLQSLGLPFFGCRLPLVQGISFASVSAMTAVLSRGGGLPTVFGAVIAAGVFGFLVAPLLARIIRLFPPVVTGSIIAVIGISLVPTASGWVMGGDSSASDYGSPAHLGLALVSLAITLVCTRIRRLSPFAVIIGIALGTVVAALMGMADFSALGTSAVFALPHPLAFGMPVFRLSAILSMCVVMVVVLVETTADILAVGTVVGSPVDGRRLANGLRADAAATALSPLLNSFPASAFAQNVGVVAMTGVRSRFVVAAGGGLLVVLGLFPILGAVLACVPSSVIGGVGLVLFGSVAASGIRTLAQVDFGGEGNSLIVAVSMAVGIIPMVMPTFYERFPAWAATILDSGITATALTAFLLNLLFNEVPARLRARRQQPEPLARPAHSTI